MTTEFAEVVAALDRRRDPEPNLPIPRRVTVLGAGPDGRALAAWLFSEGVEVTVFTVYQDELAALSSGSITLRGEGPVGTYAIGGSGLVVTSVLDAAVAEADVLFVTGPVFKLRTYGMVLAPYLGEPQALVVCPAQTFGGLEVAWWLAAGGYRRSSMLVELSRMPFAAEQAGGALHLRRLPNVAAGIRPAHRIGTLDWLRGLFPNLDGRATILHASFADGTGLVEVPALLLGGPAMEDRRSFLPGSVPLSVGSFRRLITPRVVDMVEALAAERHEVASRFGVRDLPTANHWIDQVAAGDAPSDSRPVPEPNDALELVRQGVLGSLVPLSSAARLAGMDVPATNALVQLASTILDADLASVGRRLENIGFAQTDPDGVRRAVGVGGNGQGGR